MDFLTRALPFILGLDTTIVFLTLPVAIIFFLISIFSKDQDEEKKKQYRKISLYLLSPLLVALILIVLWGFAGLWGSLG